MNRRLADKYQNKGIGKLLVKRLLIEATKWKIKEIKLSVLSDNTRAINLYRKFGFVEERFVKKADFWDRHPLDVIEMTLRSGNLLRAENG